jgi:hypothetical protein
MDKLLGLSLDGFHYLRMAMTGVTNCNSGVEIEKKIGVDIFNPDPLRFFNDKGVDTGIGLRDIGLVFLEDLSCLGSRKLGYNGGGVSRPLHFSPSDLANHVKRFLKNLEISRER